MAERAFVREVGLRDGLQMVATFLATERKLEWLAREAAAGVLEIEAASFVPSHVIAQFADAADVAEGARGIAGAAISALAVNLKGAMRAFDAGLRKINYVVSASAAHSQANVRRTMDVALDAFDRIVEERAARGLAGRVELSCGIATAFGCTIQGEVSEDVVLSIARRVAASGADEIMIADTIGYAHPVQVKRLFAALVDTVPDVPLSAHFHDTRGLGLANVSAALEVGIRRFDASLAGLGGCNFAPGATGNIDTVDCVFLLEPSGYETGIDIDALIALRRDVERWLPGERFTGSVARVGLPKTFSAPRKAGRKLRTGMDA